MMRGYVLLTNKKKGLEKMKVKKIIALLLAMSLMFAFSACGSNGDTTNSPADASNAGTSDTPDTTEPLTIAYSCVSYSLAPLTQALADNLQDRVEAQGWTFNMLTAEGDTELQGEQVSHAVIYNRNHFTAHLSCWEFHPGVFHPKPRPFSMPGRCP